MLQCAAAADAEMRTARRHARRAGFIDGNNTRNLVRGLLLQRLDAHLFAWKRALDEDRLAFDARDAAAFLIERFDRDAGAHHARVKLTILPLGPRPSGAANVELRDAHPFVRHFD